MRTNYIFLLGVFLSEENNQACVKCLKIVKKKILKSDESKFYEQQFKQKNKIPSVQHESVFIDLFNLWRNWDFYCIKVNEIRNSTKYPPVLTQNLRTSACMLKVKMEFILSVSLWVRLCKVLHNYDYIRGKGIFRMA